MYFSDWHAYLIPNEFAIFRLSKRAYIIFLKLWVSEHC